MTVCQDSNILHVVGVLPIPHKNGHPCQAAKLFKGQFTIITFTGTHNKLETHPGVYLAFTLVLKLQDIITKDDTGNPHKTLTQDKTNSGKH